MPPACTPEKRFDGHKNKSEENDSPILGFVTPPRTTHNRVPKYVDREKRHMSYLTEKLPTLADIFHLHKQIGEGTFSAVFMASLHNDNAPNKLFAIKHLVPTTHPKRIEVELCCLKKIGGQDNVVGLEFCLHENDNIVFVMPYLEHVQFSDYVGDMDSEETAFYIKNLLKAVSRVHSFGIIHRDIKPNNFLYDRKNKKFLLVDFGLAQVCSTTIPNINENQSNKRKRDCEDEVSVTVKNKETGEPVAKRPALQSKSLNSLSFTVTHLQSSLNPEKIFKPSSKENFPNMSVQEIVKRSPFKSPIKEYCKVPKKSPFKFPGLDLPSNHSKMSPKMPGQRKLFQIDEEINSSKLMPTRNSKEVKNARDTFPTPLPIKTKSDCRCYNKACICTVCLLRKGQEAPRAGTPGFRPPEVLLKYSRQTTAVDIWSVGVMMLCILSGSYPFFRAPDDMTALAEMITLFGDDRIKKVARLFGSHLICSEKKCPLDLRKVCCRLRARGEKVFKNESTTKCKACSQYIHNCVCYGASLDGIKDIFPDSAYDLLQKLLDVNPYSRITAEEALKHPFLN